MDRENADPLSTRAKLELALARARQGRLAEAKVAFEEVLAADPDCFEALMWLSNMARGVGDPNEARTLATRALEAARRTVANDPDEGEARNRLGNALFATGEYEEAAVQFELAARLRPTDPGPLRNQGLAFQMIGRRAEAAAAYDLAAQRAPTSADTLIELAKALLDVNDAPRAREVAKKAIALVPNSAAGHLLLSGALAELNLLEEAQMELERGTALDPEGKLAFMAGLRQQAVGRIDVAEESFRKAIAREPRRGSYYSRLVHNRRVTEEDRPMVDQMRRVLQAGGLPPVELEGLLYALGKSTSDLGDFHEAMEFYHQANRVAYRNKLGDATFDREAYRGIVDRTISRFTADGVASWPCQGNPSDLPILIVGMIRSGTTLVEQILSCHSRIAAAGEQPFWIQRRNEAWLEGRLLEQRLAELADRYLERLRSFGGSSERVTDKMPDNTFALGEVHLALPNARIIHVKRDPIDTCLSIYFTPNRMPVGFAHDPGNIVFAYRQYERLMEHWRAVLPAYRFCEVAYEELVTEPDNVTRHLVDFCGMEWDNACLRPELNRRAVVTPSAWQARQPVYSSSVQRWRKFEPWLGAFSELK